MRENLIQGGTRGPEGRIYLDGDWYGGGIPANVEPDRTVYLDTAYGFARFTSERPCGMRIGRATGCYDRATFISGPNGYIEVGQFAILNGTTLISHRAITIGDHCMLAWGSVLTDTWLPAALPLTARRECLRAAAHDPRRRLLPADEPRPVILEDNVWIGFDAVVLPGVRIGRGALIGSKSVVTQDVPAYAVVAGNPARVVRFLDPDDTPEALEAAFAVFSISPNTDVNAPNC